MLQPLGRCGVRPGKELRRFGLQVEAQRLTLTRSSFLVRSSTNDLETQTDGRSTSTEVYRNLVRIDTFTLEQDCGEIIFTTTSLYRGFPKDSTLRAEVHRVADIYHDRQEQYVQNVLTMNGAYTAT